MSPLYLSAIVFCMVVISSGQVILRILAQEISTPVTIDTVLRIVFNPLLIAALAMYTTTMIMWLWILRQVPLRQAYPFVALTFVFVPLIEFAIWHQRPTLSHAFGTALIVAGLVIITSYSAT